MEALRKYLGIVWMLAGVFFAFFLPWKAISTLSSAAATTEDYVFWIVILLIFIPILLGFILFGYYAWQEEYRQEG
jgi:quinol-cytochrome oxidoreductase complex cytochrome b subunit